MKRSALVLPGGRPAGVPEGVLAQSATDTPTPTNTPMPTNTPTITPTPTVTPTVIPEPTATTCGSSPLQGRTQKVVDAIVALFPGITACADVTATHLEAITHLDLRSKSLTSLQSGDFTGLTGLLYLDDNQLTTLPASLFAGLTNLQELDLHHNALTALAADQFAGLTSLTRLVLSYNALTCLPSALFAGLTSLQELHLHRNGLGSVEPSYFEYTPPANLGALTTLYFDRRPPSSGRVARPAELAAYQAAGMPALTNLYMTSSDQTSDPVCATSTETPTPTAAATETPTPANTAFRHHPLHPPAPAPTSTSTPPGTPDPTSVPTVRVLPRIIGDSGVATAYELPGDRVQLCVHRHDRPAAAVAVELGVGYISADSTMMVLVGVLRDVASGATYAVVRRETDGQIVRWWIAPENPLVALLPWAQVLRDYSFPAAVLAAIPLDRRPPAPHQLVRHFAGVDRRIVVYDAGQRQWLHVPDAATFQALGFYWCDVTVAGSAFFERLPQWAPYPASSTPAQADYPHCRP